MQGPVSFSGSDRIGVMKIEQLQGKSKILFVYTQINNITACRDLFAFVLIYIFCLEYRGTNKKFGI